MAGVMRSILAITMILTITRQIIAVRMRETRLDEFTACTGMETIRLQGLYLVRTPTCDPIVHRQWFIQQVEQVRYPPQPPRGCMHVVAASDVMK